MSIELHIPQIVVENYNNDITQLRDFSRGIETQVQLRIPQVLNVYYQLICRHLRYKNLGEDVLLYCYDDLGGKQYWGKDLSACWIDKELKYNYQIERILNTHLAFSYNTLLNNAKFLTIFDVKKFSYRTLAKILSSIYKTKPLFVFDEDIVKRRILIPEIAISTLNYQNYIHPIPFSWIFSYKLLSFICEFGREIGFENVDELRKIQEEYNRRSESILNKLGESLTLYLTEVKKFELLDALFQRLNNHTILIDEKPALMLSAFEVIKDFVNESEFVSKYSLSVEELVKYVEEAIRDGSYVFERNEWRRVKNV